MSLMKDNSGRVFLASKALVERGGFEMISESKPAPKPAPKPKPKPKPQATSDDVSKALEGWEE